MAGLVICLDRIELLRKRNKVIEKYHISFFCFYMLASNLLTNEERF